MTRTAAARRLAGWRQLRERPAACATMWQSAPTCACESTAPLLVPPAEVSSTLPAGGLRPSPGAPTRTMLKSTPLSATCAARAGGRSRTRPRKLWPAMCARFAVGKHDYTSHAFGSGLGGSPLGLDFSFSKTPRACRQPCPASHQLPIPPLQPVSSLCAGTTPAARGG